MKRPTLTIDTSRGLTNCEGTHGMLKDLAGYIDHLEAQAAPAVLDASARCPLCGHEGPHPHTPLEQVIYRNGVKAGRSAASANEGHSE